jgi:hypothetical protein
LNIKAISQEAKGPKTMQTSTPNGLQQLLMKRNSVKTGSQNTANGGSVNQSGPLQNSQFKQQLSMVSMISQKVKEMAIDENTRHLLPK